ncbi:hypothetical protein [Xanthobacter variabilis]|uniref:hypothetical protein n=1 Tax=Xanthobacter variabilis TaxID=3119932 RepID=UPI00374F94C9
MVTGVSNNSANILTLFQTGKEAGTANNEETLAKIQELAKEAEQMKAGTSPAQTQGASVATNAWIGAAETAQQPASTTTETPSATEGSKPKVYAILNPQDLAYAIERYNSSLRGIEGGRAQAEETKARLATATDQTEIDKLSTILRLETGMVTRMESTIAYFPSNIEASANDMYEKWNVSGTILINNTDGTYGMGKFDIKLKDNGIRTYYSDNSGAVWENTRHSIYDKDSWIQVAKKDERGVSALFTSRDY